MAAEPTTYGFPYAAIDAAALPEWIKNARARFSVSSMDDWKVSPLGSLDRGIRVEVGTGHGDGVTVKTHEYETMSLPYPDIATRWYLIARRRNWSGSGTATLVALPAGATPSLPAVGNAATQMKNTPGVESDQPIALVRVTQKDRTVGQDIIDLRCWAGPGGVEAAHALALTYLAEPGAAVKVGNVLHRYELQANGVWSWVEYPYRVDGATYTPVWNGFERRGDTHVSRGTYWVDGDRVTVKAMIQSGRNPSLGLGAIGFSLPPGLPTGRDFLSVGSGVASTSGTGGLMRQVVVVVGPGQNGATVWAERNPMITPGRAGFPWGQGASFHVQLEYRL